MKPQVLRSKTANVIPVRPLKKVNPLPKLKEPCVKKCKIEVLKEKPCNNEGIIANYYSIEDLKGIAFRSLGFDDYTKLINQDYAYKLCKMEKSYIEIETIEYALEILFFEQDRESKEPYALKSFIYEKRHSDDVSYATLARSTNWITSLQSDFDLNHETIHLAVGIFYAFLSRSNNVSRIDVPKRAFSSLWLAIKFEERSSPAIESLLESFSCFFACSDFFSSDVLAQEIFVLQEISFAVNRPNAYLLFRRYSRILDQDSSLVQFIGRFLLEVSLHSYNSMIAGESKRAAACLCLAKCLVFCMDNEKQDLENEDSSYSRSIWPHVLVFFTRYQLKSLLPVMKHLHNKALWLVMHVLDNDDDLDFETTLETSADEEELMKNTSMDSLSHPDREWPFKSTVEKFGNIVFNEAAFNYFKYGSVMWTQLSKMMEPT